MTTQKPAPNMPKKLVFSGIQPTGSLTLGNYLGAVRNWVALQDDSDCIYCIVDWHALTIAKGTENLAEQTRETAATLLACGIDPERHILFAQSHNPDHAELAWYFNCIARLGWLNRMTQFKDKAGKDREQASTGLYVYPNLMAADILAYRATHVPVGEDQKQHLELARDIALKFNHDWGVPDFFPLIEPLILGEATRVMSLRDGTKKMSKSDPSDMSRINLNDSSDMIAQKFRKAKTDPLPLPASMAELADRPEARNLLTIHAALTEQSLVDSLSYYAGKSFSEFKGDLVELAMTKLTPISQAYQRFLADKSELDNLLARGAKRARNLSRPVIERTREILRLL